MAVAVDAVNTAVIVFNSVSSFSGTPITATAAATSVLAGIDFTDAQATTKPTSIVIKWAAQTLSIVSGADTGFVNGSAHSNRAFLCGIGSPTTGAQTFSGTWTNAYSGYADIVSWKGGDTTTPFKNGTATALVSDTAPTVSVTSPSGDFAAGVCAVDGDTINAVGQTTWWNNATGSFGNSFANYTAGAGSTTLSGTLAGGQGWAYAACDVAAAVPAGGFAVPQQQFKIDKFKTPIRSMGPKAGLMQVKAFSQPTATTVQQQIVEILQVRQRSSYW